MFDACLVTAMCSWSRCATSGARAAGRHRSGEPGSGRPDRRADAAPLRGATAQYHTILRMAQGLGNMEGYRIPTIADHAPRRRADGSMAGPGFRA